MATVAVANLGSAEAANIVVRIYAGDPSRGGQVIGEMTLPGPLSPGERVSFQMVLESLYRNVSLYSSVDPLNSVAECNDANNIAPGPALNCSVLR